MKIAVEVKPYSEMRYKTVGDYYMEGETLQIDIADTGNPFYNKLILIHELVEWALLNARNIPISVIDAFDYGYEMERERGLHSEDSEPGFDRYCPYQAEHTLATGVEMAVCVAAGAQWSDYSEALTKLTCQKT